MAEKRALHQRLGQRGAVHGYERSLGPGTVGVDEPGEQLLAGTRFAGQQHGGIGKSGLGRLILGSQTSEVLTHASVPVLVVR